MNAETVVDGKENAHQNAGTAVSPCSQIEQTATISLAMKPRAVEFVQPSLDESGPMIMGGAFQFAKGVAATVLLAGISIAGRYGYGYLFPDVERPDDIVVNENVFRDRVSDSQQRTVSEETAIWRLAVVTNRLPEGDLAESVVEVPRRTLAEQVREASLQNPVTRYGLCDVRVPLNRRRGSCAVEGGQAVSPGTLDVVGRDQMLQSLVIERDEASPDILVFVHGFNVPLESAVARAAQLAEDIPFHGKMIAFSWQSHGRTDAYRADEVVAERYFWNLAELLYDLKQRHPDCRLHVLAHSMGNRVTLRAINALCGTIDPMGNRRLFASRSLSGASPSRADSFQSVVTATADDVKTRYPQWGEWRESVTPKPLIEHLIMAAPDVNAVEYRQWISGLRHVCRRMVLYASDTDMALEGSRIINGQKFRAGDSRAGLNIDGLTVVKVTGADREDPLGHSFYGSRTEILNQLEAMVNRRELNGAIGGAN